MLRPLALALALGWAPPAAEPTSPQAASPPNEEAERPQAQPEPEPAARRDLGGGVGGSLIDPDDPNATRATSDLEGEALDANRLGVPERLPKLQRAGWWSLFGTLTLASAGGVLAGLAERQEQEARRLAVGVDLSRGSRFVYSEVADNYDAMLSRGRQYQGASRGLFIGSAITAVASITLFALDAKRRKRESNAARLRLGAGTVEVSF